jgi:hypothetical protein|eukprot:scaffold2750_cov226-Alexandrium_tamarense.AAC.1
MMEGVRKCRLASLSHQHLTTKYKGTWTTCYLARLYQPYTELTADQAVTVCQTLNDIGIGSVKYHKTVVMQALSAVMMIVLL